MAEFQKIVQEFHRLCETQRRLNKNTCDKCPIKIATMGTMFQCYRYVLEKPNEAENIIMSWAAENPEPVYPAWRDWLRDLYINSSMTMTDILESPIEPEIAQQLNIMPRRTR